VTLARVYLSWARHFETKALEWLALWLLRRATDCAVHASEVRAGELTYWDARDLEPGE